VDLVVSRHLLSDLGEGAQSYFTWATRVCDFPQGIFVMALATAALPSLSMLAAKGDLEELARTYAHGMRLSMFVSIPASMALVVLAEPIVALLFQRGAFDEVAVRETARALVWQGGAIIAIAAVRQLVPTLYALGDTRTPMIVSAIDSVVFLGLALALRRPLGHVGVSVAIGGSTLVQMVLLFRAVKKRLGTIRAREVGGACVRFVVASVLASIAARAMVRQVGDGASHTGPHAWPHTWPHTWPALIGGFLFASVYLIAARALGCRELHEVRVRASVS
jgi:putative peptidoglycan lipid II flippase